PASTTQSPANPPQTNDRGSATGGDQRHNDRQDTDRKNGDKHGSARGDSPAGPAAQNVVAQTPPSAPTPAPATPATTTPPCAVPHDVGVGARGEARVGVAEVLGDLVERAAFVEEQGGAGVAQVVAAEVGNAGALECRDPDPPPPVLTTEVAACRVREDER